MAFTGIAAVATGLAAAVVLPLIQPAEPDAAGNPSDAKTFTTTGSVAASTSSTTPAYDRPTVDSKAASTEAEPKPAAGDVQPTAGAASPQVPAAGANGPAEEPVAVPTSDGAGATGTPEAASAPATASTRDKTAPATGPSQTATADPTPVPESTGTASSAPASPRPTASATRTERAVPDQTAPAQRSARATTSASPKPAPSTEATAPGGLPVPGVSVEIGTSEGEAALRKLRAVRGETVDDPNWRWIRAHLHGREEEHSR